MSKEHAYAYEAGYHDGATHYELDHCPSCKNTADLQDALDENAKLRELCAGLLTGYECGHGELCKGCTWDGLGDPKTFPCLPRVKARELGVEVDA